MNENRKQFGKDMPAYVVLSQKDINLIARLAKASNDEAKRNGVGNHSKRGRHCIVLNCSVSWVFENDAFQVASYALVENAQAQLNGIKRRQAEREADAIEIQRQLDRGEAIR